MKKLSIFSKLFPPTFTKVLSLIGMGTSVILGVIMFINGLSGGLGSEIDILLGLIFIFIGPVFILIFLKIIRNYKRN